MDLKLTEKTLRLFWLKVKMKSAGKGCWEWQGNVTSDKGRGVRYPQMWVSGTKVSARRLARFICLGAETNGVVAMTCQNPLCVNPLHMTTKTEANSQGEKLYHTTPKRRKPFTAAIARRVHKLHRAGRSIRLICERVDLDPATVSNILRMARFCTEGRLGAPNGESAHAAA